MNLEAKGLNQLLHILDLVSHKLTHLLRCAARYNVAVFGQLRDQFGSTGGSHEFPIQPVDDIGGGPPPRPDAPPARAPLRPPPPPPPAPGGRHRRGTPLAL